MLGGQEMKAVLADLAPYQDAEVLWSAAETALVPVLPFNMRVGEPAISMFAIMATLGTAQDVTADELRIKRCFRLTHSLRLSFAEWPRPSGDNP